MSGLRGRPRIGVTGPDRGGAAAWAFHRLAIARAGGRALWIRPGSDPQRAVDGLVLGGGADVDPGLYGARPEAPTGPQRFRARNLPVYVARRLLGTRRWRRPDPARDALETRSFERARGAGLPVLAVCRGMQLVNVLLGGSLHQDVAGFYTETPSVRSVLAKKPVRVVAGSRLASVVGASPLWVNALHHQALSTLGAGLVPVAFEDNGIVQAIEAEGPLLIGVQWHPEFLPFGPRHQALYRALVNEARARR